MTDFGDVHISRAIDGAGISGISCTSMTFRTTYDMEYVPQAGSVVLTGISGLPTFYIDKRTKSDGIWTVECLDRAAFLDRPITGLTASGDTYSMSAVQSRCAVECGLSSVGLPSAVTSMSVPKSSIDGKTYQQLLQEISEVYCGFFYISGGTALSFQSFSQTLDTDTATDWSRIMDNGEFGYGCVNVTNGSRTNKIGSGAFELDINNEFADTTETSLYYSLTQTTFYGWSTDSYIGSGVMPQVGARITFGSTVLRATRLDAHITGNKLVISAGGDIPQYGEINRKGLLQRRLDDMVSTTKVYGNGKMTPYQGYVVEGTESHT